MSLQAASRESCACEGGRSPFYPQDSRIQKWAQAGISDPDLREAYDRAVTDCAGMLTVGVLDRSRGKGMVVAAPRSEGSITQRQEQMRPLADQAVVRGLQLGLTPPQIKDVFTASLDEHQL